MKKTFEHLGLCDVNRKPPPRANIPPIESFILYDESSSPSADDYIINVDRSTLRLSTGYPIETYLKKNPAPGKTVSYARIFLHAQFHAKKSMLTGKLDSVIRLAIGSVEMMPQYVGLHPKPTHNSQFSFNTH